MNATEFRKILTYTCDNCHKEALIFNNRKTAGPPLIMCPFCNKPYSRKTKVGPTVLRKPGTMCAFTMRDPSESEAMQMATYQVAVFRKAHGFNVPAYDTDDYYELVIHTTQRILEDNYPMVYKNEENTSGSSL